MANNKEPCNEVERAPIPPEVIQEWNQVEEIVKSGKQVPLPRAIHALKCVNEHYLFDDKKEGQPRQFLDECLKPIVNQLLCQECPIEGTVEYYCVEECLKLVATIIAKNVALADDHLLLTLAMLLKRGNKCYQETATGKRTRLQVIDAFQAQGGFSSLATCLSTCSFESSSQCIDVMKSLADAMTSLVGIQPEMSPAYDDFLADLFKDLSTPSGEMNREELMSLGLKLATLSKACNTDNDEPSKSIEQPIESMYSFSSTMDERTRDAVLVANSLVALIPTLVPNEANGAQSDKLKRVLSAIGKILSQSTRSDDIRDFHRVYRDFILRLIKSEKVAVKCFGWWQLRHLVMLAIEHSPPPRTITVSQAGVSFANGVYRYAGKVGGDEGYFGRDCIRYEKITHSEEDVATERVCVIRKVISPFETSVWILTSSIKDSGESDLHYYSDVPSRGWTAPFGNGTYLHPRNVTCDGFVAPPNEEWSTLCHQTAKWAISNDLLGRYYSRDGCSEALELTTPYLNLLITVLSDMDRQAAMLPDGEQPNVNVDDYCLQNTHMLMAWSFCKDAEESVALRFCEALAGNMFWLPDDIRAFLFEQARKQPSRAVLLFRPVVKWQVESDPRYDISKLSDETRLDLKKTMWLVRTSGETSTAAIGKDLFEGWMKMEQFRPEGHQSASLQPVISLTDPDKRLVSISMPIENVTGEYFVGARVFACCDGYAETTIATLQREDMEKCLRECRGEVSIEAVLPDSGTWTISVQGLLLRKQGIIEAPRFSKTVIDLSSLDKTERPTEDQRFSFESTDEMARQNAGDILGTIGKLRGPCSAQMEVESRYSLLHTAVARGRSTLNKLKAECDDETAPGIAALTDALAKAHLPMAELEAAMKLRNKKERVKGFKAYVSSLLENGEAASWLESVDASNLQALGGDANRVYQLLELNPKELDLKTVKAASAREDLFSKKQVKKLKELCAQLDAVEEPKVALVEGGMNLNRKKAAEEVYANESERRDSFVVTPPAASATDSQRRRQETTTTAVPFASTRPPPSCNDFPLLSFLKEQEHCLKGTAESFCRWLVDSEDIVSLEDLATAVSDDVYLFETLQQGDGTRGVDGFHLNLFKKAVLGAASAGSATTGKEVKTFATASHDDDEDKENVQPSPPSMLVCPLSGVLMTKDPVLAADGHTYELAAIADYFDKQNSLIGASKRQLAAGVGSKKKKQLQKIVDRGIVSPVTHARMENLSLAPNKVVAAIARDAATKANKRVPFAGL